MFETLNIEYKGKKGTSIEVLNAIKDKHEIVEYIIRYRKIAKLISTYLDGMLNYVSEDGKIHTTFMQRTTSTGRLSSREPNLQNLPIRDDEGKVLRKMFLSSFEFFSVLFKSILITFQVKIFTQQQQVKYLVLALMK